MVDKNLHTSILTTVLSDLTDRNFIGTVKKYFESITEPSEDISTTAEILHEIIKFNIVEKDEVIYKIAGAPYSEKIISGILYDVRYSQSYKNTLLAKLNMEKCINKFVPLSEEIVDQLTIMSREGGSKKGTDALHTLFENVTELHKLTSDIKLQTTKSNVLVLDPFATDNDNLSATVDIMQVSIANKVKTLPVLDNLWGGGAIPGSLYLAGGISGFGKSLFMQNVAMYAAKNNNPKDFITKGLRPCSVFVSYEMDLRQCYERSIFWFGKEVPHMGLNESKASYTERLAKVHLQGMKEMGIQIPVVFIVQDADISIPDAGDVEAEIDNLMNDLGFYPIMVTVDYLDRMDLRHKALRSMGESGGEGAVKTRLKAREMRNVAKKFQIPFITATQLTGEAMAVIDRLAPFMTKADPLHEFGLHMIAGSKNLRAEVEGIVMVHIIDIETKDQTGEGIKKHKFIAICDEKDRDNKGTYKYSKRDKEMLHQYNSYTTMLKNSGLKEIIRTTAKSHAVIPMKGFRIDDEDWGLSIRIFFTSENADFISLANISDKVDSSLSAKAISDLEEELFSVG